MLPEVFMSVYRIKWVHRITLSAMLGLVASHSIASEGTAEESAEELKEVTEVITVAVDLPMEATTIAAEELQNEPPEIPVIDEQK